MVKALPDPPPEFAVVTDVPATPPSAEFEVAVPLIGVIAVEGADAGPVPTLLAAVTVNVYAVPFVRPVTVADVVAPTVAVKPPGDDVTV
jgi:hypothetical protein